ncbi:MAG: phenylalanine--tRNA ligase subunit alpha, partial [Pseudomonadota bacterium]
PFTEPSMQVDIGCSTDNGSPRVGAGDDWLDILGGGMVHPVVLEACDLDPAEWQGFAFWMRVDRIAMLKYGIADPGACFDSDLRWLRHYGFAALDVPTLHGGLSR